MSTRRVAKGGLNSQLLMVTKFDNFVYTQLAQNRRIPSQGDVIKFRQSSVIIDAQTTFRERKSRTVVGKSE
jgi:hypothetical protein